MNIVLLGHRDLASQYALNRLIGLLPGHRFTAFMSGTLVSKTTVPEALDQLAQLDARLCEQFLAESNVAAPLLGAIDLTAPNSPEGLDVLRQADPDVLVSVRYRRILRDDAIAIPRHGVLNLHSGILPDYRGVMASFWAMLNGEPDIGTTLHRIIDSGIDTGPVIGISRIQTRPTDSYLANVLRLYADGSEMLASAISDLARGNPVSGEPQAGGGGHYFSVPDAAAIERFRSKSLYLACGAELSQIQGLDSDTGV